ncbi:MAG: DUF1700 domain-containing protein [Herbinix sp.]|nr:DUF1700 domain-containing protein [Herbinix sp.]
MDKREFLETLRQSLNGEIMPEVIEENIRYYDQYITATTLEEEQRKLNDLGDPRLIAKTILEANKASIGKSTHTNNQEQENSRQSNQTKFLPSLRWYHKLITVFVIIFLLIILVFVGRIIIGFLFAFGLPVMIILLLVGLFRRR